MVRRCAAVLVIGLLVSIPSRALGEELRVGVYSGVGQEGILAGLADVDGIEAQALGNFSASSLGECDVVIWPHGRLISVDRTRLWRVLLTEYVRAGGGLILTHDAVGGSGAMGEQPLFGDIARSPGYAKRKDKTVLLKAPGADHALAAALPDKLTHAYYDHMALMAGPDGKAVMVDEDGDPVVVAGAFGKGRAVLMGNLPGYKGTKTWLANGRSEETDQGPAAVKGGELAMLAASIRWAGARADQAAGMTAALRAAVDQAVIVGAGGTGGEAEAVKVFGDAVAKNALSPRLWDYPKEGPLALKWGVWYGTGHRDGRGPHMYFSTLTANVPMTSQKFDRSPIKGRFVFTCDAVIAQEVAGILEFYILEEDDRKDVQDGYGIRLVYGGLENRQGAEPGKAYRFENRERIVTIGDAKHAILKITRGVVSALATVDGLGRFMTPAELPGPLREKRIKVRLERSADGVLLLSIDGLIVARVKDTATDHFNKLRVVMTTPDGCIEFDNPNLVGYFEKQTETYAPTPWIIPEPKTMARTGKLFALTDGAQFVVSSAKKIDEYLLDEWIIPEIRGRFGIQMKAVTVDQVDASKPAIYLSEGDDPVFATIFDEDLKSIATKNPGPAPGEGYAIKVDTGGARAAGAGVRGTFYALQSLVQLIERDGDAVRLRGATIKDWPDFQIRGPLSQLRMMYDMADDTPQQRTERVVRFFARYKVNAIMLGGLYYDFPSYDLSYGGVSTWEHLESTFRLLEKHHIEIIPSGFSLCHTGLHHQQGKKALWKWIVDNRVLAKTKNIQKHENSFNAMSPHAWEMCRKLNQDYLNISPDSRYFLTWFDEINPPIHTYAPEGTEDDLLEQWILKCHQHLKENGKRMMMFPSYLLEASKFAGSSASLGRPDPSESMPLHDVIDRIPKDIIMVDWYYGASPDRSVFYYLRDKGFDVIAMPASKNYGYTYRSIYHSAVEGKKAGLMGICNFMFQWGYWTNPSGNSYSLPWIYSWTVPRKVKPDWDWRAHWQDVFLGPQPSHTGEVVPLDISRACNESRIDEEAGDGKGWLDFGKHADLRKLPAGEIVTDRYRFNVVDESQNDGKSVVVVTARMSPDSSSDKVTGIPVECKAEALVFLHTCSGLGRTHPGRNRPVKYRVHYEDGTTVDAPLNYAHQIGPWIYSADTGSGTINNYYRHGYLTACRLVKTGRTGMGEKTGLYAYEWINPHPRKAIRSIDMEPGRFEDHVWTYVGGQPVHTALVALSAVKTK